MCVIANPGLTKESIMTKYEKEIKRKIAYWRRKIAYASKRITALEKELDEITKAFGEFVAEKEKDSNELKSLIEKTVKDLLESNKYDNY